MITNVYITVKVNVESDKPLTQEQLDRLETQADYNFDYSEDGVKIVETEIIESEIK